jgi:hypothetical protein
MTRSGALYHRLSRTESEVRVGELDLEGDGSAPDGTRLPESHLGTNLHPAWGPEGERIAYLSRRGADGASSHLVIKTLETGEERDLALPFPIDRRLSAPEWSEDGRHILVDGGERGASDVHPRERVSYRVEVSTGEVTREEYLRDVAGAGSLADDRQARALRELGVRLIGGHDESRFREGGEAVRPGETLLWVRSGVGQVDSIPTWDLTPVSPVGHMHGWDLSPDGRTLALGIAGDPDRFISDVLYVLPLDGGEARELVRLDNRDGGEREIVAVRWTPDGKRLLYAVDPAIETDKEHEIWTVGVDGGPPRQLDLPLDADRLQALRFHPDGHRIAFTVTQSFDELWLAEGLPWQEGEGR